MLHEVEGFLTEDLKIPREASILVAISGGVDSVVLSHLLSELPYRIALAHANFHLRAEASDLDELFVRKLADKLQVPFFSVGFDTLTLAADQGKSIQVLARELRYEWLEELCTKQEYDFIATAHHQNDAIETALFHFARGTGIRGLKSIPVRNGRIIRPLLHFFRSDIQNYAKTHGLSWREDASNAKTTYQRNFIRHRVIPQLEALHGGFEKGAAQTLANIGTAASFYAWAVRYWKERVVSIEEAHVKIQVPILKESPEAATLLWEIIYPYGFVRGQVVDILSPRTNTGALFYSATHRLVKDRDCLWLSPIEKNDPFEPSIAVTEGRIVFPEGEIQLSPVEEIPGTFGNKPEIVFLDLQPADFPLTLRPWKPGDAFQPLGMQGKHQKLQDFLTNLKLGIPEKERVWVLADAKNRICWVVGLRIDHRFRIKAQSKHCHKLELKISS